MSVSMFTPLRVAIFVDAGYLYSEGSKHLSDNGSALGRVHVQLDRDEIMARLLEIGNQKANGTPLLRTYWYDGLIEGRFNPEQQALASAENIKFRPGIVTAGGQQKEVDSLIVTDLIELARNNAISDAVLLSGDGDLKIGVQIAQSFGVRVHLVSIAPRSLVQSRSRFLFQECDTTTELTQSDIGKILALRPGADISGGVIDGTQVGEVAGEAKSDLDAVMVEFMLTFDPSDIAIVTALQSNDPIPYEIDTNLLGASRQKLGRRLDRPELTYIRERLKEVCGDAMGSSDEVGIQTAKT